MTGERIDWVVPCFDEAARLQGAAFLSLLDDCAPASVIFVDDGSRDQTLQYLRGLAEQRPDSIAVVALPENRGKAEAVRQGLLRALSGTATLVGYVDADLATPPAELRRLAELARSSECDVLMASRVQLLGRHIERRSARHYLGRVFATLASAVLHLPVYDTQCGAKLFRRTEALAAALEEPFLSRWAFDVEILARLLRPRPGVACLAPDRIREEPLFEWTDVPGSKLFPGAAVRGGLDLLRLGWKLRRR